MLKNIDRLEFSDSQDGAGVILNAYTFLFAFMLGCIQILNGSHWRANLLLTMLLFYYIGVGHKFSAIIDIITLYLVPILTWRWYVQPQVRVFSKKILTWVAIALTVILTITFYQYDSRFERSAFSLIFDRIFSMQGHVWWATDYDVMSSGRYDSFHWLKELASVFSPSSVGENDFGMRYLMLSILGDIAFKIMDSGYLYTMAYPAILIASVPYTLALIFQYLAGFIFFCLSFIIYRKIVRRQFFRAALVLSILNPYIGILFSGVFLTFFTVGIVAKIFIFLLIDFLIPMLRPSLSRSIQITN